MRSILVHTDRGPAMIARLEAALTLARATDGGDDPQGKDAADHLAREGIAAQLHGFSAEGSAAQTLEAAVRRLGGDLGHGRLWTRPGQGVSLQRCDPPFPGGLPGSGAVAGPLNAGPLNEGSTMQSGFSIACLTLALALALSGCANGAVGSTPAPLAVPVNFRAIGTEPFWGLRVAGRDVRYSTPEIPEDIARGVVRSRRAGIESVSGKLGRVRFRLTVSTETCSDGMSDRVYPFAAQLKVGKRALSGCAAAE